MLRKMTDSTVSTDMNRPIADPAQSVVDRAANGIECSNMHR